MTFDALLALLQRNYRQSIDDYEAELYESELGSVAPADLELAIRHAIRTRKFLPNVAELLEDLATVRQANPSIAAVFKPCDECSDGWITVDGRDVEVLVGLDAEGKRFTADGKPVTGTRAVKFVTETHRCAPATQRCACCIKWRRSQGLPVPAPRPSVQIDKDRAIGGDNAWTAPAKSKTVAKFKAVAGGKK